MKQETVNVFNEGLNKDLNPIVTPNNVLTDNLNGTFITFNGDELSLQNDAGNTTIPGHDDIGHVQLSEGFFPLGMKEYGGVLYIVSGKKGINENGQIDPKFHEIEFGSYPSPELASYTTFKGDKGVQLLNSEEILYKSYIINTDYFKTGRFIQFINDPDFELVFNTVWKKSDSTNSEGIYIIKLLLQLDNGVLDLTDDVWDMFEKHKIKNPSDTSQHWLLSESFIYHCPYSYKGKLALQVIVDEPIFYPEEYLEINSENNEYSFSIKITRENSDSILIVGAEVNINLDKSPPIKLIYLTSDGINKLGNLPKYQTHTPWNNGIISASFPMENKVMNYEITPILVFKRSAQEILFSDFPFEFRDKFTISGSSLLEDVFYKVGLSLRSETYVGNKKIYKAVVLVDENNNNINYELDLINPPTKPYAFIEEGSNLSSIYNVLGRYTVNSSTDIINSITLLNSSGQVITEENNLFDQTNSGLWQTIKNKLLRIKVSEENVVRPMIPIYINFSVPLMLQNNYSIIGGSLLLYQSSSGPRGIPYQVVNNRRMKAMVYQDEPLSIQFSYTGFQNVNNSVGIPLEDKEYNIGLITSFNPLMIPLGGRQVKFMTELLPSNLIDLAQGIEEKFPNTYKIRKAGNTGNYNINGMHVNSGLNNFQFYIIVNDYSNEVLPTGPQDRPGYDDGTIPEEYPVNVPTGVYKYEIVAPSVLNPGTYINNISLNGCVQLGSVYPNEGYIFMKKNGTLSGMMFDRELQPNNISV